MLKESKVIWSRQRVSRQKRQVCPQLRSRRHVDRQVHSAVWRRRFRGHDPRGGSQASHQIEDRSSYKYIKHACKNGMQEDQIPDSEKMISRNPYDESSDEDEGSPLPTVATLLKQLKLLNLVRMWKAEKLNLLIYNKSQITFSMRMLWSVYKGLTCLQYSDIWIYWYWGI